MLCGSLCNKVAARKSMLPWQLCNRLEQSNSEVDAWLSVSIEQCALCSELVGLSMKVLGLSMKELYFLHCLSIEVEV